MAVPRRVRAPMARQVLTQRECEVLDLLTTGLSRQAIGRRLGIALTTVRSHIRNIYMVLGTHSGVEAAMKWREMKETWRQQQPEVVAVVESPVPATFLLTVTELLVRFPDSPPMRFVAQPTTEVPDG